MINYQDQLIRIKSKLVEAKKADKRLKVFGAKSHQYVLNQPVTEIKVSEFEKSLSIKLPDCYKSFITQVGNGGKSHQASGAGPFYGIYPLGENVDDLIIDNVEKYLKNDCLLYPDMSDEYWQSLNKTIDDDDAISDEDYEKELGKIYAGILPIGSQGCTYLHAIVLNGKYKGRVVNLDIQRQKPQFAFESNFLDWYERWLDEVISGDLIKDSPSWFGYSKGNPEEELLNTYIHSPDPDERKDCLTGLLNKDRLKSQTVNQIEELIKTNSNDKTTLIQLLCKTDYIKSKPYLIELAETDLPSVFQFVYWFAKDRSLEWLPIIEKNIGRIEDEETFRFCTYLLLETEEDIGKMLVPFTKNSEESIRATAFYTLGRLINKKDYIDVFVEGLKDSSNYVIQITLQALSGVKDVRLLEQYKCLAEKFPVEQDYVLVNLNRRLAEYGLTNQQIVKKGINTESIARKKWYQLWK